MFEFEDLRELTDDEREEQDLVAELDAERQEREDRLDIAHLGPRQRAEERGFAAAFSRMAAARPSRGTSGCEAEHPGPEQPSRCGTSGAEAEQDRGREKDDEHGVHNEISAG